MSAAAEWGRKILEAVSELFLRGYSLKNAIQQVAESEQKAGKFESLELATESVTAVTEMPKAFGHDDDYWRQLYVARYVRRARMGFSVKGGSYANREEERGTTEGEGANPATDQTSGEGTEGETD